MSWHEGRSNRTLSAGLVGLIALCVVSLVTASVASHLQGRGASVPPVSSSSSSADDAERLNALRVEIEAARKRRDESLERLKQAQQPPPPQAPSPADGPPPTAVGGSTTTSATLLVPHEALPGKRYGAWSSWVKIGPSVFSWNLPHLNGWEAEVQMVLNDGTVVARPFLCKIKRDRQSETGYSDINDAMTPGDNRIVYWARLRWSNIPKDKPTMPARFVITITREANAFTDLGDPPKDD